MLNVQNYRITSPRISFQANEETSVTQEKKVNKPYKTHAGIKTGAVYGGLEAIGGLLMNKIQMLKVQETVIFIINKTLERRQVLF